MDVDEFIKKWCTGLLDFDNQISTFDFNLKLKISYLIIDRRGVGVLGLDDIEEEIIFMEEPLQHPIIAMQEVAFKLGELLWDLTKINHELTWKLFEIEKMIW